MSLCSMNFQIQLLIYNETFSAKLNEILFFIRFIYFYINNLILPSKKYSTKEIFFLTRTMLRLKQNCIFLSDGYGIYHRHTIFNIHYTMYASNEQQSQEISRRIILLCNVTNVKNYIIQYTRFKRRIIIRNVSDNKILALIITKVQKTFVSSSVLTDMSKMALVDAPDRQRPWVLKLFLLAKLFFYGCTKLPWQFLPHEPSSQGKHGKTFSRGNVSQMADSVHMAMTWNSLAGRFYGLLFTVRIRGLALNLSFIVSELFREFMNRSEAGYGSLIGSYGVLSCSFYFWL